MKSLMSLWSDMANDAAMSCCTSATADINTVRRRFEHEGLSFLTITLADFGKAFQKMLDQGHVDIHPAFKTDRRGFPLFLGGFLSRVFDRRSGALLDAPDIAAISAIRQLTLSFAKIQLPVSDSREKDAISEYVKCEQDVRRSDAEITEQMLFDFQRISDLLFRNLFSVMDRDIYYGNILPKHGPGAVADRLTSNGKYRMRTWTRRLDRVFPLDRYIIPNHHFVEELDDVTLLEPGTEIPVRVITVPKTMKTPRIIAIEPSHMQYMQQALLACFLNAYAKDELLTKLIGFDDQLPNQELARQGSIDGKTATLDLSEASDRVSNQLVRRMVSRWPHLSDAIDATRSRRADVPGFGVIRLAKYASMGSALCFPAEAMVFTTLIFLGIERALNVTLTKKHIRAFLGSVRVYGDDLIVPTDYVPSIVQTLEHFGARVGLGKSFWTGKFRESCGKEYFNGFDVSTVKVRQVLPSTIADVTGVISTVALRNHLYMAGYDRAVSRLDNLLNRIMKNHFPIVEPGSPVLGRVSYSQRVVTERVHPSYQSPLVQGFVVVGKPPRDPLEGTGALLKCLLRLELRHPVRDFWASLETEAEARQAPEAPTSWSPTASDDAKHLERSGRPKRVSIKLGWWSPH